MILGSFEALNTLLSRSSEQNHRLSRDFISSVAPLGCHGGVRDSVQTVWLPVARSQKACFASRKRIKAFAIATAPRSTMERSFETAFDLHSGRPSCAAYNIDARSLAATSVSNMKTSLLSFRVS